MSNLEEKKESLLVELVQIKQKWQDQLEKSAALQELKTRVEELKHSIREAEKIENAF